MRAAPLCMCGAAARLPSKLHNSVFCQTKSAAALMSRGSFSTLRRTSSLTSSSLVDQQVEWRPRGQPLLRQRPNGGQRGQITHLLIDSGSKRRSQDGQL